MSEIAGSYPVSLQAPVAVQTLRLTATRVVAPAAGGASGSATEGRTGQDTPRAPAREARTAPPDRYTLSGPPPAFKASLLEVESGFRNTMARIEAARARAEAERAYAPGPRVAEPEAEGAARAEADAAEPVAA